MVPTSRRNILLRVLADAESARVKQLQARIQELEEEETNTPTPRERKGKERRDSTG
jgi:hypothetical protein